MRKTMHIACNWKAAVDAFLEVYHVKTIHSKSVGLMLDDHAAAITLYESGHSRTAVPRNRGANDVKAEVNRELQLEDVRKMQQQLAEQARVLEQGANHEVAKVAGTIADSSKPTVEPENSIQSPKP